MYGSSLNFSGVTLPGVGGQINASNAISSDQLEAMNKTGKKWRTDAQGNLVHHNEQLLKMNEAQRARKASLVNRDRSDTEESIVAMQEIFDRKKSRMAAFKEIKRSEYNFGESCKDKSKCGCENCKTEFQAKEQKCSGKSNCNCAVCRDKKHKDTEYREWTTEQRQKIASGEVKGEMAGPNNTFPIAGPQDVAAAWSSVGRASNPRKIMANIIKIAKKHGWKSGLPKTVLDRMEEGESGLPS